MDGSKEREEGRIKSHDVKSIVQATERTGNLTRYVAQPTKNRGRSYAESVQGSGVKTFKMTIKSREAHPPEKIKQILKNKLTREKLRCGDPIKTLSGGTNSKEETEVLEKEIQVVW